MITGTRQYRTFKLGNELRAGNPIVRKDVAVISGITIKGVAGGSHRGCRVRCVACRSGMPHSARGGVGNTWQVDA